MPQCEEPEILAESDRPYGDRRERFVLEKGEWRGKPTYALRLLWQNDAGAWRWSPAKADSKGRCWASLNLKAAELRQLGLALTAEADELERAKNEAPRPTGERRRDPTPREQRELDRFDQEHQPIHRDEDIPF